MKFSILIPAYKSQFLRECIDSVLCQTVPDFEIIVLNDASPENITEIVKSYTDERIKYYENDSNVGAVDVVDNWNKCLEYASGDYCMCIGDDDKLMPNCLAEYTKLIEKYPSLSVYHGKTIQINENSRLANVTVARPEYESVYSLIWHRWTCRYAQYVGDFLYDTKKLKEKGGYYKLPLAWGSDDITAAMAAADKGIANTQVPVFQYRVNSQTISSTGNESLKIEGLAREKAWYIDFFNSLPKEEFKNHYLIVLTYIINNYYNKRYLDTIRNGIRKNRVRFMWYILNHRKQYDISLKLIAKAFAKSLYKS